MSVKFHKISESDRLSTAVILLVKTLVNSQDCQISKFQEKLQILCCKILKNKWYHAKVLLKRFHLNGHTMGFCRQTQKLELHYMSP